MGRIMLATSASTDEEYGGTFVARANEIEPVLVLSIPANTYNTWALAFGALKTAYNNLSDDDKLKCKIIRDNDYVYNLNAKYGEFIWMYKGSNLTLQSINIRDEKFQAINITATPSVSFSDISSDPQAHKLELYII